MSRTGWAGLALLLGLGLTVTLLVWRPWQDAAQDMMRLHGHVDIRQVALAFEGSERVSRMLGLQALQRGNRPEEIAQAAAQVARAQAQARQAWRHHRRLQGLARGSGSQAISQQALDEGRTRAEAAQANLRAARQAYRLARAGTRHEQLAQAEAELEAARAGQALLQHRIDQGRLLAPVDAVVRARLLEPAEMASPQRPAYALALTSPKWVRVYADATQLVRLRLNMPARVRADGDGGPEVTGQVVFISSVAEFTPRTVQTEDLRADLVYEVRIRVRDDADHLKLGMPVTAILSSERMTDTRGRHVPETHEQTMLGKPAATRAALGTQDAAWAGAPR